MNPNGSSLKRWWGQLYKGFTLLRARDEYGGSSLKRFYYVVMNSTRLTLIFLLFPSIDKT